MNLKCLGTEDTPHEEVRWLGVNYTEGNCWVCGIEGLDLASGKPGSLVSVSMRRTDYTA